MLLDEEKTTKGVEELLAVPAAVATLRQLLAAPNTPEVRLGAAKALMDIWNGVLDDEEKQQRLLKHCGAMVEADTGAVNEQLVEQLMSQVMGGDEGLESTDSEDLDEVLAKTTVAGAQAKVAPAKAAPAKAAPAAAGRNGVQEKAAPAKAKPKQADDEDAPVVPFKYWVILGVLLVTLGVYQMISWMGAPVSPAGLANRALSAASRDDRAKAAAELAAQLQGPDALEQMRRVARDTSDPEVLKLVLSGLTQRNDAGSAELFLAGMANKDPAVRDIAFKGLARVVNMPFEKRDEFKANDPEATRAEVLDRLKQQYGSDAAKKP